MTVACPVYPGRQLHPAKHGDGEDDRDRERAPRGRAGEGEPAHVDEGAAEQ